WERPNSKKPKNPLPPFGRRRVNVVVAENIVNPGRHYCVGPSSVVGRHNHRAIDPLQQSDLAFRIDLHDLPLIVTTLLAGRPAANAPTWAAHKSSAWRFSGPYWDLL